MAWLFLQNSSVLALLMHADALNLWLQGGQ